MALSLSPHKVYLRTFQVKYGPQNRAGLSGCIFDTLKVVMI